MGGPWVRHSCAAPGKASGPGVERNAFADAATGGGEHRWGALCARTVGIRDRRLPRHAWAPTDPREGRGELVHHGPSAQCLDRASWVSLALASPQRWTGTFTSSVGNVMDCGCPAGTVVDRWQTIGRCAARPSWRIPPSRCRQGAARPTVDAWRCQPPGWSGAAETWRGRGTPSRDLALFLVPTAFSGGSRSLVQLPRRRRPRPTWQCI